MHMSRLCQNAANQMLYYWSEQKTWPGLRQKQTNVQMLYKQKQFHLVRTKLKNMPRQSNQLLDHNEKSIGIDLVQTCIIVSMFYSKFLPMSPKAMSIRMRPPFLFRAIFGCHIVSIVHICKSPCEAKIIQPQNTPNDKTRYQKFIGRNWSALLVVANTRNAAGFLAS